ncbi:MAG: iron ABC transporter permease [Deltaproteobacteria bacterium]|nr:iron ABC transporter permease [Deltaproteobacteria bacterium]
MKKYIYIITILAFLFLVISPLFTMVFSSFIINGIFTLEHYLGILNKSTLLLLLKSVGLAFSVATIATLIGGFFAFTLTKTNLPKKNILKLIFLIPLFISPYIIAVSWVDFFIMFGNGKSLIYSPFGVVFVLSMIFSPLSMIIISSSLTNLSSQFEEAGLMMATYPKKIIKIILPLIKPAIFSSFILVFVLAISEFSVPAFLSVNVFTTEIFTQFAAFYNYDLAVANSLVLIFICVSLLMVERFYLTDAPFLSLSSKSHKVKIIEITKSKYLFLFIHLIYLFITVVIPVLVLFVQSFQGSPDTFRNAFTLLSSSIVDSIHYSVIGAFVLLFFGFVFAYISEREKFKSINLILLIIFGIPSTVLGIGLIKFFNTPNFNFIYSGFWIIIIGYLGRFIFIAEKLVANAIKQIPLSLEESAKLIGANFYLRIKKILLPLISNGLFAAFLISFIFCLGELGTTILVYPPGTSVTPIKVYTIMANAPQSLTSAMSLIVLMITLAALVILFAGHRLLVRQKWS